MGWSGDPLSETRLDENEARRGQEMREEGKLPLVQNGTCSSWVFRHAAPTPRARKILQLDKRSKFISLQFTLSRH